MRRLASALAALLIAAFGCGPHRGDHRVTFELATIARAADSTTTMRPRASSEDSVAVVEPPLLTGADLLRARANTRSNWTLLGGSQQTSTLVLTLKPASADRLRHALGRAVSVGDNLALIVDGQVIGMLIGQVQNALDGDELSIDAGFYSAGKAKERRADTERLAREIQAGIP